ncbi:angiopoietin-related protein 2-like [Syngnathus scovelli]|uniref:angiopoietin-related protein 2-like n=1 Tax=Syngnathus scovelli TaxID=161590 RepID=UPI00210FF76D|nr:angiopoietin-related protein 2-like [Syngnathus scovelli]
MLVGGTCGYWVTYGPCRDGYWKRGEVAELLGEGSHHGRGLEGHGVLHPRRQDGSLWESFVLTGARKCRRDGQRRLLTEGATMIRVEMAWLKGFSMFSSSSSSMESGKLEMYKLVTHSLQQQETGSSLEKKRCGCLLLAFIVVVIVLQTAAIIYLINRPQEDEELVELMSALLDNSPEHNCTDSACHWAALQTSFGDLKANQTSLLSVRQLLLDKMCQEIRSDKGLWNQELKENSSWALTGSMSSLPKKVVHKPALNREVRASTDSMSSLQTKIIDLPIIHREPKVFMVRDCTDVMAEGNFNDGVYTIISGFNAFEVYCNMSFDGGGWTVIQRRQDGSVSFSHSWDAYKNGFGTVTGEHWLGLQTIYSMTVFAGYQLRVDVTRCNGSKYFAVYDNFSVGLNLMDPERDGYPLLVDGYSGNAGDGLFTSSGMKFSTYDRDQDMSDYLNCASTYGSGWWYNRCGDTNLNGIYRKRCAGDINWYNFGLKSVEMKIRPNKAPTCRCCRKSH